LELSTPFFPRSFSHIEPFFELLLNKSVYLGMVNVVMKSFRQINVEGEVKAVIGEIKKIKKIKKIKQ